MQTAGARVEGAIRFAADRLDVGGKPVAWEQVLYFTRGPQNRSIRPPQALRLTTGEVWFLRVLGSSARAIKVRSPLFGEQEIDKGIVRSVDFVPDLEPPDARDKAGSLYREKGEPIPGPLLWIDADRLAIDSPLGVLTLAREGTVRYLFSGAPSTPTPAKDDEVSLFDGTTLRGKASLANDAIELEHPALGKLTLPAGAVRSVLRHGPAAAFLAEMAPHTVNAVPLVANAPRPEFVEYPTLGHSRGWPGELECLRGVRIEPKTAITWRLPKVQGQKTRFIATLGPLEGQRGDVVVRIASGAAKLERTLGPAAKPEQVTLDVPAGGELVVEVDFGPRIVFPCGLLLGDPIVVGR